MDRTELDFLRSLRPHKREGAELEALLAPRLPRIVLIGGPGAGKSRLRKRFAQTMPDQLHCVAEANAWMIRKCGIRPFSDPILDLVHMREHSRIRMALEDLADIQARRDGKQAVLVDRGLLDAAAYRFLFDNEDLYPFGPVEELLRLLDMTSEQIFARYDLVVFLEMPCEDVWTRKNEEARKRGKLARSESYERACQISESLRTIWSVHPNFRTKSSESMNWAHHFVIDFLKSLS